MEREAVAEAVDRLAEAVLEESASYDLASVDIVPAIRDIFYDSIFEELAIPLMGASLLPFDDIRRKGDGVAVAGFSCAFSLIGSRFISFAREGDGWKLEMRITDEADIAEIERRVRLWLFQQAHGDAFRATRENDVVARYLWLCNDRYIQERVFSSASYCVGGMPVGRDRIAAAIKAHAGIS